MTVWAFNWTPHSKRRELVYRSLRNGKSRFGWSWLDEHNLLLENNWTEEHSRQRFLLEVSPDDWIVHVNTPEWGRCVAARVTSEYGFDSGLDGDFRHCFDVDKDSIVEFDRNDNNVLPSVNLRPRRRYHRIYAIDDFLQSINHIENQPVDLEPDESRQEYHLKGKTEQYLRELPQLIHEMHRGKDLEDFLRKLFLRLPGVTEVVPNGRRWGTDHGADLIVAMTQSMAHMEFERTIVVQAKSFEGQHWETKAVTQIEHAVKRFRADAGMIVTTAERTEALERAIDKACNKTEKPIDLLAAEDLSRLVIKHAPDLVFRL